MGFITRLQEQGKLPPLPDGPGTRAIFAETGPRDTKADWEQRRIGEGLVKRTAWLSADTNARLESYRDRRGIQLSRAVDELLALALDAEERRDVRPGEES